jgi:CDP-diacylglycerol--glycerol-3-phosphate 3-phosphatidyltransferase
VVGGLVSYAKARAEGLGLRCDVGIAERSERLLIGLVSAGLAGLGVPYVLAIGLWALAVLSAVTFGQRVLAVHAAARPQQDPARDVPEQDGPQEGAPGQGAPGHGGPVLSGEVPPGGRDRGGSRPGTPRPPAGGRR